MLNAWLLRGRPERKVVNYMYCYSHLFARSSFLRIALSREYMNVAGVNFTEITTDLLNISLCGNTLCLVKSSKKKKTSNISMGNRRNGKSASITQKTTILIWQSCAFVNSRNTIKDKNAPKLGAHEYSGFLQ